MISRYLDSTFDRTGLILTCSYTFQPDHFLPRFTTLNWGICLPAACNYDDAGSIIKNFVKPYNTTGIKLFLEIEEGNCHVRQTATWTKLFKENWRLVASL